LSTINLRKPRDSQPYMEVPLSKCYDRPKIWGKYNWVWPSCH